MSFFIYYRSCLSDHLGAETFRCVVEEYLVDTHAMPRTPQFATRMVGEDRPNIAVSRDGLDPPHIASVCVTYERQRWCVALCFSIFTVPNRVRQPLAYLSLGHKISGGVGEPNSDGHPSPVTRTLWDVHRVPAASEPIAHILLCSTISPPIRLSLFRVWRANP